jgi:valyl-tRNA synthetase
MSTARELPTRYDPHASREKWYSFWEENGFFKAPDTGDRPSYSIVIPPPNVTGQLHIGHALNNTLQDVLIRYKRMDGFDTLWMPGTDHAGIATQSVVEREILKHEGKTRHDLGREELLARIWAWREKYGDRIIEQLKAMGCSCDWDRTRFTLDEGLSQAVVKVFVDLYHQGYVYRGERLINWDPKLHTTIADDEVEYEDRDGFLWTFRYPGVDFEGDIRISTTRPETIPGDTAVAVHPEDERYKHLIGKKVRVPGTDRAVPIIADEAIELGFGTGALKVTPAHDQTDFEIGERHGLERINVFTPDATMNENAGGKYVGLDRYECRKRLAEDLEAEGFLVEKEQYKNRVGVCYRSKCDIEPYLMKQWFVKMKPLMEEPIRAVRDGRVRFVPKHFENLFFHWVENVRDWAVSRQLWWGHRIPVWYCGDCGEMTCVEEEPSGCEHCGSGNLRQDEDVLDTWFSSQLWPFSTMGWPEETGLLKKYYPTGTLVTGFDIIYFWVARMIMAGLHFMGDVPFRDVYMTGLVRDLEGRKQSKSLGNALDPLDVIEAYGVDAMRLTLCMLTSQGRDMKLGASVDEKGEEVASGDNRLVGYRNFINKIWNAARLVFSNTDKGVSSPEIDPAALAWEDRWIRSRFETTVAATRKGLDAYQFAEAGGAIYDFFWKEYCDWYLELVKPRLYGEPSPSRDAAIATLLEILDGALRLLHPFCPFITEEIWQMLKETRGDLGLQTEDPGPSIMIAEYPKPQPDRIDSALEKEVAKFQDIAYAIRNIRGELGIAPKDTCEIALSGNEADKAFISTHWDRFRQLINLPEKPELIEGEEPAASSTAVVGGLRVSVLWSADFKEKEAARLSKAVEKLGQQVERQRQKLSNESFTAKAPAEVVERERENLESAEAEWKALSEKLKRLG